MEETGQEILLTRHGDPIAKVIPFKDIAQKYLGASLKGLARIAGDIIFASTELRKELLGDPLTKFLLPLQSLEISRY